MKWSLQSLYNTTVSNITWAWKGTAESVAEALNPHDDGLTVNVYSGEEYPDQQELAQNTPPTIHQLYHKSKDQEKFREKVQELTLEEIDKTEKGYTLLHKALYNGQPELVNVLLEKGADLFKEGPNNSNFLQCLAECKNPRKAFQIFKTLIKNPNIKTKIEDFDVEIYKEVIRLAIANKNSNLAQTLIAIHHSKKAILELLLEDVQPTENEKTEISAINKDILKLEGTIYELKAARQTLVEYEQDLKKQAENLEKLLPSSPDKKRAEILYKRTQENFNKEKERIGILLSPQPKIDAFSSLDQPIENLEEKLSNARTANKKHTQPYIEQIKDIQSLFATPQDLTNKLSVLTKAIEAGDSDKIRLLLEAQDKDSKYYNITNQYDETILNIGFKKIKEIEAKLDPKSADYQKNKDIIKSIYSSIDLILKQPDFNLESTLNYQLPQAKKKNGSLEEKKPQILLQAYIDFKENSNNQDPEIKYQKDILFKNLLQNKEAEKYLGKREKALALLEASARYNDPETYGKLTGFTGELSPQEKNNILFYAAQSGSQLIFNNVMNYSSDNFPQKFPDNSNMLMCACKGGSLEIVKTIIKDPKRFNVDINHIDKDGNNALHYLARSNGQDNIEIIENLIELGANIEAKNKEGQTPLISAILLGNVALVKELLAKGADVNALDKQGNTPLIYAVHLNNPQVIEAILSANELDVSHKNNKGISAYTISLSRDYVKDAINADPQGKITKDGKTEVSDEAKDAITQNENKYPDLSKILLSRGADPYKVSPTTLAGLALTTVIASGAMKAAELISNIKDPWGIGATFGAALRAGTTLVAGAAVYNASNNYMQGLFKRMKKKHSEKTSLEDEVMIGTVHKGGWLISTIKKGTALQKDMKNHPNFKDAVPDNTKDPKIEGGIFTLEALKARIRDKKDRDPNFQDWSIKAQRSLQDKYITTKRAIEKSSWADRLLGRRSVLEKNLAEITEASKLFINCSDNKTTRAGIGSTEVWKPGGSENKTFDEINADVVNAIKPPKGPKALLTALIRNADTKSSDIEKINNIIRQVIEKKILVSPDTYYHFCEFEKIRKITCKNQNARDNFLAANYDEGFVPPKIDQQNLINNASLEQLTSVNKTGLETKTKPPSLVQRATELGQELLDKYVLIRPIEKIVTTIFSGFVTYKTITLANKEVLESHRLQAGLAASAAAAVAIVDNMIGSPVRTIMSLPMNVITGTASLAVNYPVAATAVAMGTTAVGAALYYRPWEYFYKNKTKEKIKLTPISIGKSSIPDLLTESELETKKGKQIDVISTLFSSYKKPKIPLTEARAVKVIRKNTKILLAQKRADKLTSSDTSSERTSSNNSTVTSLSGMSPEALKAATSAGKPARTFVAPSTDRDTFSSETASMTSNNSSRTNSSEVFAAAKKAAAPARRISRDMPRSRGGVVGIFSRGESRTDIK